MAHWQTFDSPVRYGSVSRLLHWTMAAIVLLQFVSAACHFLLERTHPVRDFFWGTHTSVGFAILVLVLVRGAWALANLRRRPPAGNVRFGRLAPLGHLVLYLLMIAIPTLGLVRQWGAGREFSAFGIPIFQGTSGPEVGALVEAGNGFHGLLGWSLLALVVAHALVAVSHNVLWNEDVVRRMVGTPGAGGASPR
ncbi:cytochrome b [Coralloluteibacterium stylophorae]|uniref:Cytochrome b n=1 Tax=Coralloluteibacterium stylophorae TaxID=1776034 RepID=A0A8J7VV25_9GAMM|nr:cytochrome b [Coralloluteibacterium stylophorae]MBS7457547.1 cytochrome b [Coralloluteibacterium stylophorae]